MAAPERENILFIISGPSGSGKETIIRALLNNLPELQRISTYTTRPMRPGEEQGRPYNFITDEEFDRHLASGEIFEHETVYGSFRYGSPRHALDGDPDSDSIMELDPNGYRRLKKARSQQTVGIFLLVPDLETLTKRIMARHKEMDHAARLEAARIQIREAGDYDYLLMNDDLDRCCREAVAICETERIRRRGRRQQKELLSS